MQEVSKYQTFKWGICLGNHVVTTGYPWLENFINVKSLLVVLLSLKIVGRKNLCHVTDKMFGLHNYQLNTAPVHHTTLHYPIHLKNIIPIIRLLDQFEVRISVNYLYIASAHNWRLFHTETV